MTWYWIGLSAFFVYGWTNNGRGFVSMLVGLVIVTWLLETYWDKNGDPQAKLWEEVEANTGRTCDRCGQATQRKTSIIGDTSPMFYPYLKCGCPYGQPPKFM